MSKSLTRFISIVFLAAVSSHFGCKNSGINPPDLPQGADTTSHDFTWQIDTIGAQGVLHDVAIIDENNILAVGEIYLRDSVGQLDPKAYSVAVWNGIGWKAKRIRDTANQLIPSVRGILALAQDNLWLADGGVHHWNGVASQADLSFGRISLIGGSENGQSVDRLWGVGSSSLYGVGQKGMITHFNGSSWEKVESGTTADIHDVWGGVGERGSTLAVASSPTETKVLTFGAQGVDSLSWSVSIRLRSVWVSYEGSVFVSGDGVWKKATLSWERVSSLPEYFYTAIRGSADNDMAVVSWNGVVVHYNGRSWYRYSEIPPWMNFESVAVSNNMIVAVGFTGGLWADKAVILIGRRLN